MDHVSFQLSPNEKHVVKATFRKHAVHRALWVLVRSSSNAKQQIIESRKYQYISSIVWFVLEEVSIRAKDEGNGKEYFADVGRVMSLTL